jgi:hypothetical protein
VGFEPNIPVFERAKTFHALDRATTGIGWEYIRMLIIVIYYLASYLYVTSNLTDASLFLPHSQFAADALLPLQLVFCLQKLLLATT